jgi:hypothetical protein
MSSSTGTAPTTDAISGSRARYRDSGRNGEPSCKDEDGLEAAVAADVRTREAAEAIRAEGELVIRERRWPTGFEDAAPSPEWPAPELFAGWDVA